MALTPAEQAELDHLEEIQRQEQDQQEGAPHAEAHIAHVAKPLPEEGHSDFSPLRAFVLGPVRDAAQNVFDFVEDAGDALERKLGGPVITFGKNAPNGVIGVLSGQEAIDFTNKTRQMPQLPGLRGEEHAGTAEKVVRGILGYMLPYTAVAKALGVMEASTLLGRAGLGVAAGAITTATAQDPVEGNMANVLKETFGLDTPVLNALTTETDDNRLVARLKAAAADVPLGIASEALFEAGALGIRAYRGVRGDKEAARALVETMRGDFSIKRPKPSELVDAEAGAIEPPKPSTDAFDEATHVGITPEAAPKTWEDVLDFLKRHTGGDLNVDEKIADNLAAIAHDDPENLLARLGIDPTKLDWNEFANPEGARNLHKAIMDVYEGIANRLGRTGKVVGEAEIHAGARALASTADVLKTLYGATSKLPETLMAARMFVGGHAHKLLDDAEKALNALLKEEGGDEAWKAFLESFHRHAFYLGAVRGAGSEIARALRSLQMIAKTDPKGVAVSLGKDIEKASGKDVDGAAAKAAADEQLNSVLSIESDAEKISLLNTLLHKEGDIGELAQFVRMKSGSFAKRLDGAVQETVGNLFSLATAAFNVKSGFSMLGLRATARWLSAASRLALAPFSKEMSRAARVATAEAWAYTDGILTGFGKAVTQAVATIEREGASELFVNADNLGLAKVAKRAAKWQAEARAKEGGINFERIDLDTRPRVLGFNPADRRELMEFIESHTAEGLVRRALGWYVRTAGAMLNTAGTATRAGTILFINAPDQFVGSIGIKAGAQAFAVRQAAIEAAEKGIEGKELSEFLKARVVSLTSDIDGWSDKGLEEGFRSAAAAAGQHEAREILFQDALETGASRAASKLFQQPGLHMLVPFVHTPLRIMERTIIDYTPIGLLKDRMRRAILAGGPQRDQAIAQMTMGVLMMAIGYRMAEDRGIVGNDGGFMSTARLERENYSMLIGGDVYEFKRDDPIGTMFGFGSDVKAYLDHNNDKGPKAEENAKAMFEAGAWAIAANMLAKTWLQSIADLGDLVKAASDNQFDTGLRKYLNNQARRFVPGAGIQKGIEHTFDPFEREATTFMENMLKYTIGASKLPVKRNFLGEPERVNEGERFIGLTWQPHSTDPLILELENLSFQAPPPVREIEGIRLTPHQVSRFNELKGQVITSDKFGGLTMHEALNKVIRMPEYQGLRKEARVFQLRGIFKEYTKAAKEELLRENPELAKKVLAQKIFDKGREANLTDTRINQVTRIQEQRLGQELGLIASDD